MRGLEPPRGFPHTDLNRARLPIPPHPRAADIIAACSRPSRAAMWLFRTYHGRRAEGRGHRRHRRARLVGRCPGSLGFAVGPVRPGRPRARPGAAGRRRSGAHAGRARPRRPQAEPAGAGERLAPADARIRPAVAGRPARGRSSRGVRPLALPHRRERPRRRAAGERGRPPVEGARCRGGLPERLVRTCPRPRAPADRSAAAVGPGSGGQHRRRPQDRRDRHRDRPRPPVLRTVLVHDAGRLPERAARLHEREGHRRPRVPAARGGLARSRPRLPRRRVRPRHARGRHRGRERKHLRGRWHRPGPRLRSGAGRVPRQLQRAHDP